MHGLTWQEQATWRDTLRKKVEERCVTLESTVSSFAAENTGLTEQLSALQVI